MKIHKVKKHLLGGKTQVSLEAPEFENFGERLDEMQRLADEANPVDPEEVRASTAKMMDHMKTQKNGNVSPESYTLLSAPAERSGGGALVRSATLLYFEKA